MKNYLVFSHGEKVIMNTLLFDKDRYDRLYNCSYYSTSEWDSLRQSRIGLRLIYGSVGVFYAIRVRVVFW